LSITVLLLNYGSTRGLLSSRGTTVVSHPSYHLHNGAASSQLFYTFENNNDGEDDENTFQQPRFTLDMSQTLSGPSVEDAIFTWLESLTTVERSEPTWIVDNDFLTTLSPSSLLQEHLESLMPLHFLQNSSIAAALFPTEWSRHKFDCDWREGFLKTMPTDILQDIFHDHANIKSNSHPLRLQLVALPPDTALRMHVHAAVEFNVPMVGDFWETVPVHKHGRDVTLPATDVQRPLNMQRGTPLNTNHWSAQPTSEELQMVSTQLAQELKETLQQIVDHNDFHLQERVVTAGQCLVNIPGSIHQSFTKADNARDRIGNNSLHRGGCLLWAMGPNVHIHFPLTIDD
jgi:hypothetical protein